MKKNFRMIHDENLCIGCQACSVSCRSENSVPDNLYRVQVQIKTSGTFPDLRMDFRRQSCVMCDNPPCVDVCPTGASYQTVDGLTLIKSDLCVSCKYCMVACPYDARFVNPESDAVDKCTFCFINRVSQGMDTACVTVCPTDALVFGDMNDKTSKVYKKAKEKYLLYPKAEKGTKPRVAFVPNKKGVNHE